MTRHRPKSVTWLDALFLIAITVFAIASSTVFAFFELHRRSAIREASTRASDLCSLFEEHIERIFSSLDWLGEAAAKAYRENSADLAAAQTALADLKGRDRFIRTISVVGKDGRVVVSTSSTNLGTDRSDREHIQAQMQSLGTALFVGTPVIGRTSGHLLIPISRRIYDLKGEWFAILVLSYDPDRLAEFFAKAYLGPNSDISLLRGDGVLLARSTGPDIHIGKNFSNGAVFGESIKKGIAIGQIQTRSVVDGVDRRVAFRWLRDRQLVVTVGFDPEALSQWPSAMRGISIVGLAVLLLGLILTWWLSRKLMLEREKSNASRIREAEVLAKNRLLNSVLSSTGVIVVVFDHTGRPTFFNETARMLLSDAPGGAVDVHWLLGDACRGGIDKEMSFQVSLATGDGSRKAIHWTIAPARWITESSLVAIGFDRTAISESERILFQQARLTTLGEMSTGLAHELAQPLTAIALAASAIAKSGSHDANTNGAIKLLRTATDRVKNTVDRMRIYGRRNRLAETQTAFDIKDAIDSIKVLTKRQLELEGIEISGNLSDDVLIARGDQQLLEQVLLNTVLNARDAIKSAPTGGRRCGSIAIEGGRLDKQHIYLRVTDDGPGIPESLRSKIFEPFFTTKLHGSGLGLALSYGIMKEMKGSFSLLSSDGGACFEIIIPSDEALDIADEAADVTSTDGPRERGCEALHS
jgi:signal transduction histidine kinase